MRSHTLTPAALAKLEGKKETKPIKSGEASTGSAANTAGSKKGGNRG